MVDFLHLHQVKFGSDTSDYGAGLLYVEPLHRVWLSEAEFRAKYKHTVLKTTAMAPVDAQSDVRIILTEGQKVYYTDCLWDGTASTAATFGVALARDLRFNSHRGDINDFGKVVLNVLANNLAPISKDPGGGGYNPADPFLHNDGFQIFASTNTTDIVFKGFKVLSPNIQSELQPIFFDSDPGSNYSKVLVDTVIIQGANPTVPLKAQFAGVIADSRISNTSFPVQNMTIRQDLLPPLVAFSPTNVRIHNFDVSGVDYLAPGISVTYKSSNGNVANPADISNELNAITGLSGVRFSNIKVQ
jgi:hypothetical protein